MMNFADKYGQWALVTGGSTGIGFTLAKQAASCGMDIILVARIGCKALGRKATVIAGFLNKFYVWQNRFIPRSVPVKLFGVLVRRAIRKEKRVELLSVSAGVRS